MTVDGKKGINKMMVVIEMILKLTLVQMDHLLARLYKRTNNGHRQQYHPHVYNSCPVWITDSLIRIGHCPIYSHPAMFQEQIATYYTLMQVVLCMRHEKKPANLRGTHRWASKCCWPWKWNVRGVRKGNKFGSWRWENFFPLPPAGRAAGIGQRTFFFTSAFWTLKL